MAALRIEGCVIVSADGMLADETGEMPQSLKFAGDQHWFESVLDRTDLIIHGRHSFEDQPRSPQRRRIVLTRSVAALAPDPSNPNSTHWNPAGASFEDACEHAGITAGTATVIGGPEVFTMFLDRYDTFWLSLAPHVRLPGGKLAFAGANGRLPQALLADHGLVPAEPRVLDPAEGVTLTAWRRDA